jgi:hypothetical protein
MTTNEAIQIVGALGYDLVVDKYNGYENRVKAIETILSKLEKVREVLDEVGDVKEPQNVEYEHYADYCEIKYLTDIINELKEATQC